MTYNTYLVLTLRPLVSTWRPGRPADHHLSLAIAYVLLVSAAAPWLWRGGIPSSYAGLVITPAAAFARLSHLPTCNNNLYNMCNNNIHDGAPPPPAHIISLFPAAVNFPHHHRPVHTKIIAASYIVYLLLLQGSAAAPPPGHGSRYVVVVGGGGGGDLE